MSRTWTRSGLFFVSALAVASAVPADAAAQQAKAMPAAPEGWVIRHDRPHAAGAPALEFVSMAPGWHVTTGPAAILYKPTHTASGAFRIETETFLFNPGERREGFGIFVGGKDLDGDAQSYTYFLVRKDGRFLIKRRQGAETAVIQDWTEHSAIVSWDARPNKEGDHQTAKNALAIDAGPESVAFLINGQEVARLPRKDLDVDGIVGLRVNHSVNIHVTRLDVQKKGS